MNDFYVGKDVLVTGGCGSIGSALVDELIASGAHKVRSFDNHEAGQFELSLKHAASPSLRLLVGDVRDLERLTWAMEGVDIVFHAAALKHVPLCEYNPAEAVKTNIMGTLNVISAARAAGVDKVTLISTDKAVNPVNAMGASKMMAEKVFLDAGIGETHTKYSVVRFGNVLGSKGSVVDVFRDQIAAGGPVTVTSGEMSRFIMSISQAVELVLRATEETEGREVYILKMDAIMVPDLARAMAEVYAPAYGRAAGDIVTKVIGARPGEKLHEQLLSFEELPYTTERDAYFVHRPPVVVPNLVEEGGEAAEIERAGYDSAAAPKLTVDEIVHLIRSDSHL